MRLAILTTLGAVVFAIGGASNAQESEISNDPFDPFVGVLTALPISALSQDGDPLAQGSSNLSTFRMRDSGRIEHYLKVELTYVLAAHYGATRRINVDRAHYEGGGAADFEIIETSEDCVPSGLCKITEVLSVRFPFQSIQGGAIRVQFRNRSSSWRGTVAVPAELFAHNLKQLKTVSPAR